ncbi:MAG: efflux RND transporter periplasmic adaptor subunit [Opitutaceae bacterium]|nr:efflux RND transporter periplasmic adaptor subunit [Opitutaceae bacterium]
MAKSRSLGGILFVILLIGGISAGGYYFWKENASRPPEVATVVVTRGEIIQAVTSTGDVQPVVTTDVSSQISGQIIEVAVDYNSKVKKGDVLARLDTATYDSRLRQAQAQLANTRANYTLAKLNFERTKQLFERSLVSQQDLDQAEAQIQQADAQLQIQSAAVENAKTDLSRCTIYAPIDGIVIDRIAEVGKTVAASLNAPTLFTIVNDLTKMQIKAAVAEADIGTIELGQDVNFTVDAFPNHQFHGKVVQLRNLPTTAQNVVTYATIIEVRNDDLKLKPGMTATVAIIVARRPDALRVPNAALRARIPEEFIAAAASAASPAAGKAEGGDRARTGGEKSSASSKGGSGRDQMRQLMADAGVDFRSGPPSPDALARLQALAKERGIELPERFGNRGSGKTAQAVVRTVYKFAGTSENPKAEPVSIRVGITDGAFTEVLSGLAENDRLVTSITRDGAVPVSTSRPTSNPFSGSRGRHF